MPQVRTATPADVPAIVLRWNELMQAHQGLDPALYALAPNAAESYAAYLRRQLDQRDALVLVAAERRDLAGFLVGGAGLRAPVYRIRQVGMIHDVGVRPDARGQGVGRALVAAAEAWFRARGLRWMQVDFSPDNDLAARFWTGLGYRTLLHEAYRRLE